MPSYTRIPSLSTALEQERLELLQEVHDQRKSSARRSSPATRTTTSTAPPARNSLGDPNGPSAPSARTAPLPGELPPRHGSIAGIGVGVTPPSGRRNNGFDSSPASSLRNTPSTTTDPPSPATTQSATTTTATAPPPLPKPKTTTSSAPPPLEQPPRRRASDQSSSDKSVEPKLEQRPRPSIRWDDSVSMSPSASGHGGARRSSQQSPEKPANRALPGKNAMAAVMSGLDLRVNLPSFARGRDSSRSSTRRGTSLDSKFSAPRFARSSSPRNRMISPSSTRTPPASSSLAKSSTETPKAPDAGKTTEVETGDRTSKLPAHQEASESMMKSSAQSSHPEDQRLEKDKYDSDNNPIESSEEEDDDDSSSSDEEDSPSGLVERGRSTTVTRSSTDNSEAETSTSSSPSPSTATSATTISPTSTTQSQPETNGKEEHEDNAESAAEKSDFVHSSKLGPIPKKPDVHPRTSFDASPSVPTTPFGSDDEAELSDIKRAQKLGIQMSPINSSVHNRSIRTIIRGNYTNLPEYADGSRRRRRKYMVATDLSEESVYALEWTIGTILRDGDTLFAVCAIYEETGAAPTSVQGDGAKAMQDAAAVVGSQTEETAQKPHNDSGTNLPRALLGRLGSGTDSKPGSVDARGMSKTEAERVRAVESISETCVRLLRKTLLQVRVAVEVIHCKSPKHMLTEAIDGLDPTLVIVGARGRSALKGVLLGSFSNYLVMHSSVPVMVARRKLKKHSKNKKTNIRLSNNLSAPKKLAHAKVD